MWIIWLAYWVMFVWLQLTYCLNVLFLALSRLNLWPDKASVQVGFKMFLGVTASVSNWDADGTCCSIILEDNPLVDFVELPDTCQGLYYCNILSGVIRGALEMVTPLCLHNLQYLPFYGISPTVLFFVSYMPLTIDICFIIKSQDFAIAWKLFIDRAYYIKSFEQQSTRNYEKFLLYAM